MLRLAMSWGAGIDHIVQKITCEQILAAMRYYFRMDGESLSAEALMEFVLTAGGALEAIYAETDALDARMQKNGAAFLTEQIQGLYWQIASADAEFTPNLLQEYILAKMILLWPLVGDDDFLPQPSKDDVSKIYEVIKSRYEYEDDEDEEDEDLIDGLPAFHSSGHNLEEAQIRANVQACVSFADMIAPDGISPVFWDMDYEMFDLMTFEQVKEFLTTETAEFLGIQDDFDPSGFRA